MTLTVYKELEQRSEEWYEARRGLVTASMAGKLLTPTRMIANNDTSRGTIATLAAERITGDIDETPMNSDMWRGVEHEPFARDAYEQHHAPVEEVGFMVREFDTEGTRFKIGYSPDGLVGDDGAIEIKCPRAKGHISTILGDDVPAFYMPQLQTGLLVSGRKWIDYVSFVAGLPLYVKRVYPLAGWTSAIEAAAFEAECSIDDLMARYLTATEGMPATERVPDLDDITF